MMFQATAYRIDLAINVFKVDLDEKTLGFNTVTLLNLTRLLLAFWTLVRLPAYIQFRLAIIQADLTYRTHIALILVEIALKCLLFAMGKNRQKTTGKNSITVIFQMLRKRIRVFFQSWWG